MKKKVLKKYNCVGLFGTCGNTTFRKDIMIPAFEAAGVNYFNPQLAPDAWNDEAAALEAQHLANDRIICFPITKDTYASGSLAETGLSLLQAVNINKQSKIILMIDMDLAPELEENPVAAKESKRARRLVAAHLAQLNLPNLFIVSSIEEMTEVAILLYKSEQLLREAELLERNALPDWAKEEED